MIKLEYKDIFDNNKTKELLIKKQSISEEYSEKSLFALIVDGKSMQPNILDKEVIVVDLSQKILLDEKIYVVHFEGKMWVKKYDETSQNFISINPEFSHLVYNKDEVHIVGKVLEISR